LQDLGTFSWAVYSIARGINNSGQVVGASGTSTVTRAFLWESGSPMQDLGTLAEENYNRAVKINNSGQVVGMANISSGNRAFLWEEGSPMQDIGTLVGGSASSAWGINNLGHVVGYSSINNEPRAFIYEDNLMKDLNDLFINTLGMTVILRVAADINDSGQIVGTGSFDGKNHAYLLTPIPELVSIDIIPKGCPSECPIKGGGSVEVAIHGKADFDVTNIDVASVRLEGVAPTRSSLKDKSTPVSSPVDECDCTSEGKDGFLDLCLKFDKKEILSALDEVNVGDSFVLTLTGSLNDGTPIEGQDCIVIVKKGKKD